MYPKSSAAQVIKRPYFEILAILSHSSVISRAFSALTPTASMSASSGKAIIRREPLSFPAKTLDPFLFCVYHNDKYPAGDDKMQAPRRGNGADFNPSAPYRMYHGDRIPGFPQHPHRGFEVRGQCCLGYPVIHRNYRKHVVYNINLDGHCDSYGANRPLGLRGQCRALRRGGPAVDDGRPRSRPRGDVSPGAQRQAQHAAPVPDMAEPAQEVEDGRARIRYGER
jgi:hypothetical protein